MIVITSLNRVTSALGRKQLVKDFDKSRSLPCPEFCSIEERQCGLLDYPSNGNVSSSWYQDVQVATHSCDDRHQVDEPTEQTCHCTQWTESGPVCISTEEIETVHGTNEPETNEEPEPYHGPEFSDRRKVCLKKSYHPCGV
jgi:hypothetical protein